MTITPTQDAPGTPLPWTQEPEEKFDAGDVPRPWIGRIEENRFAALGCGNDVAEANANAAYIVTAANAYPELVAALEAAAVRFETVRARIHRLGATPGMKALELADYTRQCEAEIDAALLKAKAGVL